MFRSVCQNVASDVRDGRWRQAWARVAAFANLCWIAARGHASTCIRRWTNGPHSPKNHHRVYRVYAFNEGKGPGFHREISLRMFRADTWEDDVRELTGWESPRLEVRYVLRNKKYRMVLRPGDACRVPLDEPAHRVARLLSARLHGPRGADIECDVTDRVLKYQGPRGDFHASSGLRVRVHDMFPFDDHADNVARFSHVRLVDSVGNVKDLDYALNPAVAACPE